MKVSRYAVLALATAVAFGFAMSPVMAQSTAPTPTQAAKDASKDAMKSSSDAMKSSSDAMKSDAMKSDAMKSSSDAMQSSGDAMKSDATKSGATKSSTHHKKHKAGSTEPAHASSASH